MTIFKCLILIFKSPNQGINESNNSQSYNAKLVSENILCRRRAPNMCIIYYLKIERKIRLCVKQLYMTLLFPVLLLDFEKREPNCRMFSVRYNRYVRYLSNSNFTCFEERHREIVFFFFQKKCSFKSLKINAKH